MINKGFGIVQDNVYGKLASMGYQLKSAGEEDGIIEAVYAGEKNAYKLKYEKESQKFFLLSTDVVDGEIGSNFSVVETYLFDDTAEQYEKEARYLAAEFCDTIESKSPKRQAAQRAQAKKDKENDETGAVFFANRFPAVMPELREPIMEHKKYYGVLLPNEFCGTCVSAAMIKMLDDNSDKQKIKKFFDLLSDMYKSGDLDVKSIIVQNILAKITKNIHKDIAKENMSAELAKAWSAGAKYYGKKVKPDKKTMTQKVLEQSEGARLQ